MDKKKSLPIWGGIECTINRIGDNYHDQLESAGHYTRIDDIETFASLGIRVFRYPILWEKYQPSEEKEIDWSFAREGIDKLIRHGVEPIIGMVHHGSGPSFVNFFDGSFESGLTEYARQLVLAFPEVKYFTPVNEPLTTARFCGLYGHWFPHKSDDYSFSKILLSECRATVMAMEVILKINPTAKLIVTEDLGKTYSTPLLQYQANFENERRWVSFDLISGRVNEAHPMWSYLLWCGLSVAELNWFQNHHCEIETLGLNYYITSERYLDENLHLYPVESHGGNGRHSYADVEVVRVPYERQTGFSALVMEAWSRYELPLAITEVHIHCTREEQLRWFLHIYRSSQELVSIGISIIGITCWAMLGSFGWDKLLKFPGGNYEPGAFRLSAGKLIPTALARLLRDICNGTMIIDPLLNSGGWWNSDHRFLFHLNRIEHNIIQTNGIKPLLLIGGNGTLGKAFIHECDKRNIYCLPLNHAQLDITNPEQIEVILKDYKPWAVINASGYVRVDAAENDPESCYAINTQGVINLATICKAQEIPLVTFSTDLVFNGYKVGYYTESDPVDPINVYGKSKALAEKALSTIYPESLIIRTSAFFGPVDPYNFANSLINTIRQGRRFNAANDIYISPTYVPDLVKIALDMIIDRESGIRHISNEESISWSDFGLMICKAAKLKPELMKAVPALELGYIADRPLNSAIKSDYGSRLPSLELAVARFVEDSRFLV